MAAERRTRLLPSPSLPPNGKRGEWVGVGARGSGKDWEGGRGRDCVLPSGREWGRMIGRSAVGA
eukprot:9477216-Pyramimonas_sp.AAC.2